MNEQQVTAEVAAPDAPAQPTQTPTAEAGTTQSSSANTPGTLLTDRAAEGDQKAETAPQDPKAEDKPADEGSKENAKVPEAYEFKFPDGVEIDPDTVGNLGELAKELGLTQEQAQKIADLGIKQSERWVEAQVKAMEAAEKEWIDALHGDKEFGGDKLNANVATAGKALDRFGTPELVAFLKESRLGNHPEVIRLMYRVGKAIADDSVVPGGRSTNERKPFYENSDHR